MLQSITKEGYGLLYAIRGSESDTNAGGYNMRYSPNGGATFGSFDKHPMIKESVPWRSDGKKSDAAGAYQFLSSTWNPIASQYGLNDFSPANQDKGAWILAQRDYKAKTGRDLQTDLESGKQQKVFNTLSSTWTSLPGGSEKNSKTNNALTNYQKGIECGLSVSCWGAKFGNGLGNLGRSMYGDEEIPFEQTPYGQAYIETQNDYDNIFIRIGVGIAGAILLTIGLVKMKV